MAATHLGSVATTMLAHDSMAESASDLLLNLSNLGHNSTMARPILALMATYETGSKDRDHHVATTPVLGPFTAKPSPGNARLGLKSLSHKSIRASQKAQNRIYERSARHDSLAGPPTNRSFWRLMRRALKTEATMLPPHRCSGRLRPSLRPPSSVLCSNCITFKIGTDL